MKKFSQIYGICLLVHSATALAVPVETASIQKTSASKKDCDINTQSSVLANILAGKDSRDVPDSCSAQLDLLLTKIVPTALPATKNTVRAFERDIAYTSISFTSAPARLVELQKLRVTKKDNTQQEFKYGSKSAADKTWGDWKTLYIDATDCEADAAKIVAESRMAQPSYGAADCAGAYGRAAKKYNPIVTQGKNGVADLNGLVLNMHHVGAVVIVPATWVVLDGPKEVVKLPVYRVKVSSASDGARTTWEATYGKKNNAEDAVESLKTAMEK